MKKSKISKTSLTLSDLPESEKSKIAILIDKLVTLAKEHEEITATLEIERQHNLSEKERYNTQITSLITTIDSLRKEKENYEFNDDKKHHLTLSFLSIYQKKIDDLIQNNNNINKLIDEQINQHTNQYKKQLSDNDKIIHELNQKLETLRIEINEKNVIIDELKNNQTNEIIQKNQIIHELNNQLNMKDNEIIDLKNNLSYLNDEITKLHEKEARSVIEIDMLNNKINELNDIIIDKDNTILLLKTNSIVQSTNHNEIKLNDSLNQSIDLSDRKPVESQRSIPDISAMFSSINDESNDTNQNHIIQNNNQQVTNLNKIQKSRTNEIKKVKKAIRIDKEKISNKVPDKIIDTNESNQSLNETKKSYGIDNYDQSTINIYNNTKSKNKNIYYNSSLFTLLDEIEEENNNRNSLNK